MKGNVFKQAFWSIWFAFGTFTGGSREGWKAAGWVGGWARQRVSFKG